MKDKRAPPERRKYQGITGKRMHKRKEEEPVMGPGNEQKNTGFCFPEYLKNIKNEQKNEQNKNPVPKDFPKGERQNSGAFRNPRIYCT